MPLALHLAVCFCSASSTSCLRVSAFFSPCSHRPFPIVHSLPSGSDGIFYQDAEIAILDSQVGCSPHTVPHFQALAMCAPPPWGAHGQEFIAKPCVTSAIFVCPSGACVVRVHDLRGAPRGMVGMSMQVSAVVLSYNSINLNEGESGSYSAILSSAPLANVIVVLYTNCSQLSASPSRLLFTPSNWSTYNFVVAAAAKDGVNQVSNEPHPNVHLCAHLCGSCVFLCTFAHFCVLSCASACVIECVHNAQLIGDGRV